jgi:hypothetical protein
LLLGCDGVRHLKQEFRGVICWRLSYHGVLEAIDHLLHQICIISLEIWLFESCIRCLSKILVRSAEVIFEIDPSLLNFRFSVPFGDVVLETTSFVEYDVGLGKMV